MRRLGWPSVWGAAVGLSFSRSSLAAGEAYADQALIRAPGRGSRLSSSREDRRSSTPDGGRPACPLTSHPLCRCRGSGLNFKRPKAVPRKERRASRRGARVVSAQNAVAPCTVLGEGRLGTGGGRQLTGRAAGSWVPWVAPLERRLCMGRASRFSPPAGRGVRRGASLVAFAAFAQALKP